jgi:hypothetical protein
MTAWYRDPGARFLIARRYLPLLAFLNLAWEIAQVPLYTISRQASASYIAFAVAHCTAGDVLIGTAALGAALIAVRAGPAREWPWWKVGTVATLAGVAYTVMSELMNTALRQSWQYSELMPTLELRGVVIGISPLAQWLVLPPLALYFARRLSAR